MTYNIPTIDNDALRKMLAEGNGTPKKVYEKDKRLYNTFIDLKKNPEHNAIIRFLPPSEHYPNWFVKGMKHKPSKGFGKPFLDLHCPKFYDSTQSCAICDYLAAKWNEFTKEERNIYKRKVYFLANILVIKDPQNPDLEGKVMLWNYPQSIHDKIMEKWAPKDQLEEPSDVFNYDEKGRNFKLKITKVPGSGYYDFDSSSWQDPSPLYGGDAEKINAVHAALYNLAEVIDEQRKYHTSDYVKTRFEKYMNPPMLNESEDDLEKRFGLEPDFTPGVLRELEKEKTETAVEKTENPVASKPQMTSATTDVVEEDFDF